MKKQFSLLLFVLTTASVFAQQKWSETPKGAYNLVTNPNGQALGYAPASGINLLTVNGLAFKDLNRNGKLDPFEDWLQYSNKKGIANGFR